MDESETTHAILRDIREQLRLSREETTEQLRISREETNARLDRLAAEVAQTNRRIDTTNRQIDTTNRQLLTTETRLVTEISALRAVLTEAEPGRRQFRERLEQCERDIAELRQRE